MSRQLTLSGMCFKPKPFLKNATTLYQKFVNKKWSETSHRFESKQAFLKNVLSEWEKVKSNSEFVEHYINRDIPEDKIGTKPYFTLIKTTAVPTQSKNEAKNIESTFRQSSPTSTIAPACCDNSETLSENAPSDKETPESYLKSQEMVQISNFLVEIGATPTDFLTTDIINDESFLKFFTSLMYSWNV